MNMNRMNRMNPVKRQRGTSFVEIMIGVLIFAVGMIALTSLQLSLTRSQADSNSRAVGVGRQVGEWNAGLLRHVLRGRDHLSGDAKCPSTTVSLRAAGRPDAASGASSAASAARKASSVR